MSGSNTGAPRVALPAPSGALAAKAARSTVGNAILVNKSQRGNTALEHIKGVPWEYSSEILADYQVGSTTGVLFLSLKYHHLHTQYIFTRFEKLGRNYDLRILLILCDVTEHQGSIKELTKACLLNNMTVVVAWSPEEVGQYLATYKLYEFKSHQLIKERVDADYSSILRAALTTVRGVNKTDVMTLRTNFGSFSNIVHATTEDMQLCPGFGPTKVRRLREAFNKPFYSTGQKPLGIRTDPITSSIMGADVGAAEPDLPIPDDAPRNTLATGNISAPSPSRTHRHSSPEWDIESTPPLPLADATLDLALDLNPSDEDMPVGQGTSAIPDQDKSLYEVAGPSAPKKRRADN